jgi:ribose/xylose/arabinose/galactoside ABC-type transport system permease subunit
MSQASVTDEIETRKARLDWSQLPFLISEYGVVIAFIVLCIGLAIADPVFVSGRNLSNVLAQVSINGLLAIGETFAILLAGIDLSVGSVLALSGVLAASVGTTTGMNHPFAGIALGLLAGALIGLLNGVVISKLRVEPFIVTLGTLAIAQGITFVYSNGQQIPNLNDVFSVLGTGSVFGVPVPGLIFLAAFAVASFLLSRTVFGRRIYAVGGNEHASRLSGVNTDRVKIAAYVISGVLAAMGGIILDGRVDAGLPQAGSGYELNAIAAVVIGGTSLAGGRGRMWGTLVGALLIGVLANGQTLLNVSPYYQYIVEGVIIILAVLLDYRNKIVR